MNGVTITNGSYTVSGNNNVVINGQVVSGGSGKKVDYTDADGIQYCINPYGVWESTVVGCNANLNGKKLVIPATDPRGYRVSAIDAYAFQNAGISSLVLPSSVVTIKPYAFYNCANLLNISFSEGLERIEPYAFYNCMSLSSLAFPKSVLSLGEYAFYNCMSLSSVRYLGKRPNIGYYTFYNCPNLR